MARPPLLLLVVMVVVGLGVALGSGVDLHKRIVRGQVCGPHERLYHVRLQIFDGKGYVTCGGSLIRPQWILTAAHCADNAQYIIAVLGVHPDPDPAKVTVVQITAPPVIYSGPDGRNHDIMLLRLTNPAPAGIPTVALPNCQNRLNEGDRVQAAGHASTTTLANNQRNPRTVDDLHCAEFEVVNRGSLVQIFQHPHNQKHRHKLSQRWLAAQDPQRSVDICDGDSGGGVVDTATRHLYGVISFTGEGDIACAEAFAFMDVCEYIGWINGVIGAPPSPPRPGRPGSPPSPPRRERSRSRSPPSLPRRERSRSPPSPPRPGQSGPPSGGAPRRKKSRWDPAVRN